MKNATLTRLGDVMTITSGFAFKSGSFSDKEHGLPLVRIRDVERGFSETFFQGEYEEKYVVQNGDLLVSMDGEFRVKPWEGGRALLNQRVCRLEPNPRLLHPSYLKRLIAPELKKIEDRTPFVTVKHLSSKTLLDLECLLPPLPEQRRIADILDKADSIRRKRQEVSSSLENFPLGVFKHLFGHPDTNPSKWPMLPFSKVCDSRLGKMLDAKKQSGKHNRPYMRNLNVQWGRLDLSQIYEMDFDKSDRAEFRLKHGDVLVCEGGAGVGQTAIWRDELPECYFQKSLHRVRPLAGKATPEYIAYLMWTLMKGSSLLRSISSATIPHLTGEKLKDILIPVPPLQLQQHFSNQCQTIARLSSKAAENLKITDDLFNSLVQQAFRGAL